MDFAKHVCKGMVYLESKSFVHRLNNRHSLNLKGEEERKKGEREEGRREASQRGDGGRERSGGGGRGGREGNERGVGNEGEEKEGC